MIFLTEDSSISSYCWLIRSDNLGDSTLAWAGCIDWTFSTTVWALAAGLCSRTSARITLPLGPVPWISLMLIPLSSACFLAMGEMKTLSPCLEVVFSLTVSVLVDSTDFALTASWDLVDSPV